VLLRELNTLLLLGLVALADRQTEATKQAVEIQHLAPLLPLAVVTGHITKLPQVAGLEVADQMSRQVARQAIRQALRRHKVIAVETL
jgi:hypothetical protein